MGIVPSFRLDPKTGKKLVTSENHPAYAAMIQSLDESVGRVITKLKEIGEYENTLFIFLSDNGSTTDDVPCAPFNGGKNSTYEAGVRVPAIITWPGRVKAGQVSQEVISIADVFNTIIEASGAKLAPDFQGDGVSLMPILKGERLKTDRKLIWYFPDSREHWGQRANAAIFDPQSELKYIMYFNGDEDELYHIANDKEERDNILSQHPEKAEDLKKQLIAEIAKSYNELPEPPETFKANVEKRLNLVQ
jgi:arylsulfatase A-like enzyme